MRYVMFSLCVFALLPVVGCRSWSKEEIAASWDSVDRGAAIAKQHGLRFEAEVEIADRTHFGFIEALVIESPVKAKARAWLDPAIAKDAPATERPLAAPEPEPQAPPEQPAVTEPTTQPVEDE